LSGRLGEVARLTRIDDGNFKPVRHQLNTTAALVTTGGFEHDQLDRVRSQSIDER
jgi:hypothetical protein